MAERDPELPEIEELGGVMRVAVPSATLPPYHATNCYWIPGQGGWWLVDTGDGSPDGQAALEASHRRLGSPALEGILVTHWHDDHAGGAGWAQTRFGAQVWAGPNEVHQMAQRYPATSVLPWPEDGRLGTGRVMEAPGHTAGQLNVWLPDDRLLLAGDNVLGATTTVVVPPDGNLTQYLKTLETLIALGPEVIGPGHGPVVRDGVSRLQYYRDHRRTRTRQVVELLADRPQNARELAERIYAGEAPETVAAGAWMMAAHLAQLVEEGYAVEQEDGRCALI